MFFALLGIGVATGVFGRRKLFFRGSDVEEILKHRGSRSRVQKEAASELDASERPGIGVSFGRHELPAR